MAVAHGSLTVEGLGAQHGSRIEALRRRRRPSSASDEFREIGHRLVDQIAERLAGIPNRLVTTRTNRRPRSGGRWGPSRPSRRGCRRRSIGRRGDRPPLRRTRSSTGIRVSSAASRRVRRPSGCSATSWPPPSTRTWGRGSCRPSRPRSRDRSCVWIAELIGFPPVTADCWSAAATWPISSASPPPVRPRLRWDVRKEGLSREGPDAGRLRLRGHARLDQEGRRHVRAGHRRDPPHRHRPEQRMDVTASRRRIEQDRSLGDHPLLVVGTAGSVGTGAVDPSGRSPPSAGAHELWFHVDGAYGALAAQAAGSPLSLRGLCEADSVAVDLDKWLYAPLEAGCGAGGAIPSGCAAPFPTPRPTTTSTIRR